MLHQLFFLPFCQVQIDFHCYRYNCTVILDSKVAIGSSVPGRAICFSGSVQSHAVSVLIDSGSSTSFISNAMATKLVGVSALSSYSSVRVVGGGMLQSSQLLVQVPWTIDQFTFLTDFRVLPLASYDIIVGMDWLEQFSPMHIHWLEKWMMIPYQGQWVFLQGLQSVLPDKLLLQVCQVSKPVGSSSTSESPELQPSGTSDYPLKIQAILD